MKNLRNKNQPPPETAIQTFLSTSWDKVLAVYKRLADIELLANTIGAGNLDGVLTAADIDTIAKLNAILTDATLGDFASQAEAEAGASNTKTMTPLRVAQAIAVMAAGIKNNFTAVVNPTPSDDLSLGYAAGSVWINIVGTTAEAFRCADPTEGAAVWIKTTLTADELATIALSGNSDDLVEGVAKLLMTVAERDKLALIEPEATADQSAAEIEAGYNAQIAVASQLEAEAGMLTDVRRWTPERIKQAIATLSTGGLAWSSANTSITVAKNTGTVFYALGGGVTATLPATPAVGDMLMIANNDNSALLYSVTVTAGTGNEIHEENVIAIPSWILGRGMRAIFVCYDAGAIKKWHMLRSDTPGFGGGGMAVVETKTADYTASVNEVVPVNSTGGAFTITMPASAAAQARVIIMDVGKACGTNNVTLGRNGATFDSVAEDFVINQNHGRVDASSNGSDDWSTHLIGSPDIISANTVFIVYKNANYTVQPGERVMVDSAVAGLTITLPLAPVAGASVGVWDAGNNASVNTVAIARNGQTIDGVAADDVLDISAGHFEFVFNGSTWKRSFWAPGGLALADVVGTQTDYYDAASGRLIAWLASGASGPTYQDGGANSAQPYMFIALPDSGQPNATLNTVLPKRWNVGQVRVRFFWKQAVAGAGAIVLGFGTNSANDNESMLGAIGGYGSVTDTAPNDINKIMVTGWTSSAVVTDAPTAGALIQFYLYRQPANVLDTLATAVRLLGVELEWTSNAATDA